MKAIVLTVAALAVWHASALRVSRQTVQMSNVSVGSELRSFGFVAGGWAQLLFSMSPRGDVFANVSLLVCSEAEVKRIYGASATALCTRTCTSHRALGVALDDVNVSWVAGLRSRYHFVVTNLDCRAANDSSRRPNQPVRFDLLVAYTLANPGTASPELSLEDTRLPAVSKALAIVATFCFIGCFAVATAVVVHTRRAVSYDRLFAALVAEHRIHFAAIFAAASFAVCVGALCSARYWSGFAQVGAARFWLSFWARMFLGVAHATVLSALHVWLGGKRSAEEGGELLRIEVLWVSAALSVFCLSFTFYQDTHYGWAAGMLALALSVWAVTRFLDMHELARRRDIRSDIGAREERSSLVLGSSGDEDIPRVAMALRGPWAPWKWFAPCLAVSEALWLALPGILPWWLFWARFQPFVLAIVCPVLCALVLYPRVSRPPVAPSQHIDIEPTIIHEETGRRPT
jgi:hypothetical protein